MPYYIPDNWRIVEYYRGYFTIERKVKRTLFLIFYYYEWLSEEKVCGTEAQARQRLREIIDRTEQYERDKHNYPRYITE